METVFSPRISPVVSLAQAAWGVFYLAALGLALMIAFRLDSTIAMLPGFSGALNVVGVLLGAFIALFFAMDLYFGTQTSYGIKSGGIELRKNGAARTIPFSEVKDIEKIGSGAIGGIALEERKTGRILQSWNALSALSVPVVMVGFFEFGKFWPLKAISDGEFALISAKEGKYIVSPNDVDAFIREAKKQLAKTR